MIFQLKILIAKLLIKLWWATPVELYYSCHERYRYAQIIITKYPLGIGKIEIDNYSEYQFTAWLKDCGLIVTGGKYFTLMVYARLRNGWVSFDANDNGTGLGLDRFSYDDKRTRKGKLVNLIKAHQASVMMGTPLNNNTPMYNFDNLYNKLQEFK